MKKSLALVAFLVVLCGCGSGSEPDAKVEANRLEAAQTTRRLFDKAGGVYEKLTPEDKTEFLKLYNGDEAKAKQMWGMMQGGGARQAGPSGG